LPTNIRRHRLRGGGGYPNHGGEVATVPARELAHMPVSGVTFAGVLAAWPNAGAAAGLQYPPLRRVKG
jgi:hypothetical protein